LLLDRLWSYIAHAGLLHGQTNRSRVSCISFVGLNERSSKLRVQQDDLMTQRRYLPSPPVRTAARFQCDTTRDSLTEKLDQLLPRKPPIDDLPGIAFNPIHLKNAFRNVQPVGNGVHDEYSLFKW
jgi:hypothetical protein